MWRRSKVLVDYVTIGLEPKKTADLRQRSQQIDVLALLARSRDDNLAAALGPSGHPQRVTADALRALRDDILAVAFALPVELTLDADL